MGFKYANYSQWSGFRTSFEQVGSEDKITDVFAKQCIDVLHRTTPYPKIPLRHVGLHEICEENTWVSNRN